ncbi:hypothetical protein MMC13_001683 [Lambiella insularis]|nr:hypothetical protein [Lambiella insularis]
MDNSTSPNVNTLVHLVDEKLNPIEDVSANMVQQVIIDYTGMEAEILSRVREVILFITKLEQKVIRRGKASIVQTRVTIQSGVVQEEEESPRSRALLEDFLVEESQERQSVSQKQQSPQTQPVKKNVPNLGLKHRTYSQTAAETLLLCLPFAEPDESIRFKLGKNI